MTKNNTTAAFAALANTDRNARTTGVGYGTDNPKKKPGRTPVKRHRTSFSHSRTGTSLNVSPNTTAAESATLTPSSVPSKKQPNEKDSLSKYRQKDNR